MSSPDHLRQAKCIVVKVGSALVAESAKPRQVWLDDLAKDIAHIRSSETKVVLVVSGAIALGRQYFGDRKPKKLEEKQGAAALGQPLLMGAMRKAFEPHGLAVAQSLLTLEDTENRRRWLNARATLRTVMECDAIPIINENDTVATDEIRYGDNDRLAARVAQMVQADLLVLLSDIDGLYTADPREDANAKHIPILEKITEEIEAMAGGANISSGVGSGGMATKIIAAKIAQSAGCSTLITLGDRAAPLSAILNGAKGTWVVANMSPDKARETWLRSHLAPEGEIHIDDGAVTAIENGSSLLPIGVVRIAGQFARGAAVSIVAPNGNPIGKGITAYSSDDAVLIAGLHTEDIAKTLGVQGRPAIVHRDDLAIGT